MSVLVEAYADRRAGEYCRNKGDPGELQQYNPRSIEEQVLRRNVWGQDKGEQGNKRERGFRVEGVAQEALSHGFWQGVLGHLELLFRGSGFLLRPQSPVP